MAVRHWASRWALAATLLCASPSVARPPDLVFVLLDTTRADRLSAFGNPHPTTPVLDALAATGVLFTRHFANAHATRPSFPQLMTGRYFHSSILRRFSASEHPREFAFTRDDPTAILLPAFLRDAGYQTLGASAHPWVVADSPLGRGFERLEFVASPAEAGHADAAQVVDQALALRAARDPARPLFLYVHLMDMHMPRVLPSGALRFSVDGFDWRTRFTADGLPLFDPERRRWRRSDARDFTERDRAHFAAVYDTRLAYADGELRRLFAALQAGDPGLQHTVVSVVADHGEELGEDGRTDHTDSLADGVQHIPWIVAGGGVAAGQRLGRFSENVDVVPTLLGLLGLSLPPGVSVDGTPMLGSDGRLCAGCGKRAAFYAWEDYEGVRTRHEMLRQRPAGSRGARCSGPATLYHMDGGHLDVAAPTPENARRASHLVRLLRARLAAKARAFAAARYGPATSTVLLRSDFWSLPDGAVVSCVDVEADVDRRDFPRGWFWTPNGIALLEPPAAPLPVRVAMPDGDYDVDVAAVPIRSRPWLFGVDRWRRKSFVGEAPLEYLPAGRRTARAGGLTVELPASAGYRMLGVRLRPPGLVEPAGAAGETPAQAEQRKRLKALGYVQ